MNRGRLLAIMMWVLLLVGRLDAEELGPLPEDPMAGARLFQQHQCIRCHSVIDEDGGRIGPNLARIHFRGSLLDIAGAMWNHAPMMLTKMEEMDIEPPRLTSREMANLIAFLGAYQYYLKQLGQPGDPEKGSRFFKAKGCNICHSLKAGGKTGKIGPNLRGYARLSPIQVAQAMWNHGPAMAKEFQKLGLSRPQFTGTEMGDLLAFLQRAAAPADAEPVYVEPGSPNRGRMLFKEKGCANCHAIRGRGGAPGFPDLGKRREAFVRSVTEVAGFMWNHGTVMWEQMRERRVPAVTFQGNEMADIIAYLYFINYFDRPGDATRGKELFTQKGCVRCHTMAGVGGSIGPDLSVSNAVGSPIKTITAMWNHARTMQPAMHAQGIPWPKFEPGEMTDLMEFIYSQHRKPSVTAPK